MSRVPIEPPYLELSFYVPQLSDGDGLAKCVECLLTRGAEFTGTVDLWQANGARAISLSLPLERDIRSVECDESELRGLLYDPDVRISTVYLLNATRCVGRKWEELSHAGLPEEFAASESHPIVLTSDASDVPEPTLTPRALWKALCEYEVFVELAKSLNAAYGAITVEEYLSTPAMWAESVDSAGREFHVFYISRWFPGPIRYKCVEELYSEAYKEHFELGTYFSTKRGYNPERLQIEPYQRVAEMSCSLARILADAGREWQGDRMRTHGPVHAVPIETAFERASDLTLGSTEPPRSPAESDVAEVVELILDSIDRGSEEFFQSVRDRGMTLNQFRAVKIALAVTTAIFGGSTESEPSSD